jgi:hypothetical protein
MGYQLIGIVQLDDHFSIGRFIERVDRRFNDMLSQGRTGIGLHPPFDGRFLGCMHKGRVYRCGCHCRGTHACLFNKIASFHSA